MFRLTLPVVRFDGPTLPLARCPRSPPTAPTGPPRHEDVLDLELHALCDESFGETGCFFPGGKQDLGVAVIETTGAIYRELFESIAGAASDPAQGVLDVFFGAAATLEQTDFIDPCPIGTVAREVANVSEPLRLATSRAFDSWVDAVTSHLAEAGLDADEARSLAELGVTSLEGGFVLSRSRRDAAILKRVGQRVTSLIRAEIAAATSAQRSGT